MKFVSIFFIIKKLINYDHYALCSWCNTTRRANPLKAAIVSFMKITESMDRGRVVNARWE